jgi:hypothetical protein
MGVKLILRNALVVSEINVKKGDICDTCRCTQIILHGIG